ncbi:MAG: polysaccharide deacetylase family protein [Gemmatimonadaceae bacterium]
MAGTGNRDIEGASHTATHARLSRLGDVDIALELARSRGPIRAALDADPAAVSWPFGAHA